MPPTRHLLTVWNPAYATDALGAHLELLLEWDARATAGDASSDDVYVWWGKVRSVQRQQPMPHLDEILALDGALGPDGSNETQLYLTDFRSLYVAEIGAVVSGDPRGEDSPHVPRYYAESSLACDCWFCLYDLRVLVRDDLEGVTHELAQLRNVRYHDRPVSIYGGMVDLPLIVTRPDGRRFFSGGERSQLADGLLWARFDAERGGTGAMEAVLRDDHFGVDAWNRLDPGARRFLATAERAYREARNDRAADLSPVIVSYGKAIEAHVNELLRCSLADAPRDARLVKIRDATRDVLDALPLTIGELAYVLGGERKLGERLAANVERGS